jgi:CRISPR system Cascade subunit CasC
MRLIELHILQSFPVSCLNRDDVGAPKTAIFGGVTRGRISSQCLKRAIREYAREEYPAARFGGSRSRFIIEPLQKALEADKRTKAKAEHLAMQVADELAGLDTKTVDKVDKDAWAAKKHTRPRVGTLIFLSPAEITALAKKVAELVDQGKDVDSKALTKVCKATPLSDAADIAVFGRMVASGPSLTLEGAAMFNHALTTHRTDPDIDFFSAVDDEKLPEEDAGAAHTNVLEFTSGVYYRYAGINLGLLADADHLGKLSGEERRTVVDALIRATILAVPSARRNSMNAHTLPGYVLGVVREKGQPLQLINAFEKPVAPKNGLMDASIDVLNRHWGNLKNTWDIKPAFECAIPAKNLGLFCEEIVQHV